MFLKKYIIAFKIMMQFVGLEKIGVLLAELSSTSYHK